MRENNVLEELDNVIRGYPLWPGDTISHETARICEVRRWIRRRSSDGKWVPTQLGIAVHQGRGR